MKCLVCKKRNAIKHIQYGWLPCKECSQSNIKLGIAHEFIPERIKEDRRAHIKDTIQPYRGDTLSKEYLDKFGTKGIAPSKEQIKNAENVWDDHDAGSGNYYKE